MAFRRGAIPAAPLSDIPTRLDDLVINVTPVIISKIILI
jgi:hypothetical protein